MNFTDEDAQRLTRLLKTADGGCGTCGRALLEGMNVLDPSRDWDALGEATTDDWWDTPDGEADMKRSSGE